MSSTSSKNSRPPTSAPAAAPAAAVAEIHPTSRWQEPARDDELTLWEVHRKPRKLVNKERRIRCPLKMLNPQFRCVICLDYLKKTTMVMVCLHRFCGECINKCIRFGMKECPSCRKPIPSRRNLRRDTNFDHIVNNMVGSPEYRKDCEDQDGKHDADKMVHLQRAIIKKKQIVERQKQQQKQQQKAANANKSNSSTSASAPYAAAPRLVNFEQSPLLEVELRRHPREEKVGRLERGYLKLRSDAKVSLLKTFLSGKLEKREYEISSTFDDDSVVLDDDLSLMDAKETLCTQDDQVMVLKYRVSATDTTTVDVDVDVDVVESEASVAGDIQMDEMSEETEKNDKKQRTTEGEETASPSQERVLDEAERNQDSSSEDEPMPERNQVPSSEDEPMSDTMPVDYHQQNELRREKEAIISAIKKGLVSEETIDEPSKTIVDPSIRNPALYDSSDDESLYNAGLSRGGATLPAEERQEEPEPDV